jgi:hypothetical protein
VRLTFGLAAIGLGLGGLPLAGCHSAGPYGHSRVYSPLDAEEEALHGAKNYDPVMVQREPLKWKGKPVNVFGVVKSRNDGAGGAAYLTLSVRVLEPRNLCDTEDEDTCRVTVSEREHAVVHAQVRLESADHIGQDSVGAGSLVRIVGVLGDELDTNDGMPVLRATYYRHWPRDYYVTTAARSHMRR